MNVKHSKFGLIIIGLLTESSFHTCNIFLYRNGTEDAADVSFKNSFRN